MLSQLGGQWDLRNHRGSREARGVGGTRADTGLDGSSLTIPDHRGSVWSPTWTIMSYTQQLLSLKNFHHLMFFLRLFFRAFSVHNKIEEKIQRFPLYPLRPHTPSFLRRLHLHQRGHLVQSMKLH